MFEDPRPVMSPGLSTLPVEGMGEQEESSEMPGRTRGRDNDREAEQASAEVQRGFFPVTPGRPHWGCWLSGDQNGSRAMMSALGEGQFKGPEVEMSLASIARRRLV